MQSKNKIIPVITLLVGLWLAACNQSASHTTTQHHPPQVSPTAVAPRVPAHLTALPDLKSLAPTLPPERFNGKVRKAYQVAREIPQTLTQLPCFCYCDTIGHKSLHTCYEDEHSAGCDVCMDSALIAAELKQQGRSDAEIRSQLIAKYNSPNTH
ncbi:MAG: hypothetical protein JNM09_14200 [Blastocatellia bacterium]|nr:hypothetical protein [Blastocatellia bacterium]